MSIKVTNEEAKHLLDSLIKTQHGIKIRIEELNSEFAKNEKSIISLRGQIQDEELEAPNA